MPVNFPRQGLARPEHRTSLVLVVIIYVVILTCPDYKITVSICAAAAACAIAAELQRRWLCPIRSAG